ncbi:MAG: hypothetical protein KAQ63_00095 [Candidatus Moranbacteria bacterium]|nr:hypothetical protein [Candidatus Moranbacteria bacterium]
MEKIIFPNATGEDNYHIKEIREKRGIPISNRRKIKEIKSIIKLGAGTSLMFYLNYLISTLPVD